MKTLLTTISNTLNTFLIDLTEVFTNRQQKQLINRFETLLNALNSNNSAECKYYLNLLDNM